MSLNINYLSIISYMAILKPIGYYWIEIFLSDEVKIRCIFTIVYPLLVQWTHYIYYFLISTSFLI